MRIQTDISTIGANMGAAIKLDLTSDVTHLIVGNTDSAKYRYVAKCRDDVKVVSPAWIEALRTMWMQGSDDVDLAALEAEHRMPTFAGLKICLTGFDDRKYRLHATRDNADGAQRTSGGTFRRPSTGTGRSTTAILPKSSRT